MSVRRRLFLSNMLMLILPIITMVITSICVLLIYVGLQNNQNTEAMNSGILLFNRIDDINNYAEKWKKGMSQKDIQHDIELYNQDHRKAGRKLSLYLRNQQKNSNKYYNTTFFYESNDELINTNHLLVTDLVTEYHVLVGDYIVQLTDTSITLPSEEQRRPIIVGIVMFIILVIAVLLTNWFLSKFVFNSIMNPIQALINGVNHITKGNLDYRIQYSKHSEFNEVFNKFNEMAQYLSIMVSQRQKDESNRRELIAGISHDLRTPLTSVKAYLEGIEKGVALTPTMQKKYFNIIKEKTESLEHIINQLFLFSKLDIGEFPFYLECLNIAYEIDRMMVGFSTEYSSRGLEIQVYNNISKTEVMVDIVQLRNIIQNVLENSVKYKNKKNAIINMVCTEKEHYVEILLGDNGPGVPQNEMERLFDVFYRGDDSRKKPHLGSGLGLAISRKIIERFGGTIHADRAASGGLAIIIRLPKLKGVRGDSKN